MSQITLLMGERRRTWSESEKIAVLAEAFTPGAVVSKVAQRHGVSTGLLYTWRRKELAAAGPAFVQAIVADEPARPQRDDGSVIRVELATARVSITASASPTLVSTVLRALR